MTSEAVVSPNFSMPSSMPLSCSESTAVISRACERSSAVTESLCLGTTLLTITELFTSTDDSG